MEKFENENLPLTGTKDNPAAINFDADFIKNTEALPEVNRNSIKKYYRIWWM